jgi:hypothetical protein
MAEMWPRVQVMCRVRASRRVGVRHGLFDVEIVKHVRADDAQTSLMVVVVGKEGPKVGAW